MTVLNCFVGLPLVNKFRRSNKEDKEHKEDPQRRAEDQSVDPPIIHHSVQDKPAAAPVATDDDQVLISNQRRQTTDAPQISVRTPTFELPNPIENDAPPTPNSLAPSSPSRRNSNASSRPRSDSGKSSSGDDSLKARLHNNRRECHRKHQFFFVPRCILEEFITEEVVARDIRATNPSVTEEAALNYARQACKSAKSLYAILACLKKGGDIYSFMEEGLSDKNLPFARKPVACKKFAQQLKNGTPIKTLDKWSDKHLEKFDRKQFWMTAPVFELEEHYELDIKDNLPFLCLKDDEEVNKPKNQGGYSEVYPVRIHPAHHKFWKHSGPEDEEPLVAVKQLFSSDETEFKKEETILKALGIKRHPHFIKLLATYKQDEKYHLLFPYADSNLREYWERFLSPAFDKPTVLWSLKQMTGIANGLSLIHIYRVSIPLSVPGEVRVPGKGAKLSVLRGEEQYGRHGDIKPENVLWFKNHPEIQDDMGVLQLADFGLGRFHGRDSRSRVDPATIAASPTYEPPECKLGKDVSRKYDIWSLGCLYLEFITWLLKGSNQIEAFANRRGIFNPHSGIDEDNFFTLVQDPDHGPLFATVREQVVAWVDELHSHEKCSQLIHDLLDLTMRELLKPDPQDRGQAVWIFQQMRLFLDTASKDEDYLLKPVPFQQKPSTGRTKSNSDAPTNSNKPNLKRPVVKFSITEKKRPLSKDNANAILPRPKDLVLRNMNTPNYTESFMPKHYDTWPRPTS